VKRLEAWENLSVQVPPVGGSSIVASLTAMAAFKTDTETCPPSMRWDFRTKTRTLAASSCIVF
jgi:hypothetical protein